MDGGQSNKTQVEVNTIPAFSWKALVQLAKLRLASSVVFSAMAGYLIAVPEFSWLTFTLLILGGFLVVGASNGFNQVIEKEQDAQMDRTKNRPIPSGTMTVQQAIWAAGTMGLAGVITLYIINPLSAGFGLASLLLYVFCYTPMKAKSSWAVFIGAIPGAIPFMLGWVAATNDFDIESGTLFAIQFMWQFPHFWALAWILDDDYKKAGYKLLPSGFRDRGSAFQILVYTIGMVLVCLLPAFAGLTGSLEFTKTSAIIIAVLGGAMVFLAARLFRSRETGDARNLFLASLAYLPLVQIIMVLDKFLA